MSEKTPSVREGMKASERFNEHDATTQITCINPTHAGWYSFFTMMKTRALTRGTNIIEIGRFGLIKAGVPTDSGEFTPIDTATNTLSLLEKEGIKQVKWLK